MDGNPPITAKNVTFLTPLISFYLFSKTSATLIDGSENATVNVDLNFGFSMLLKGAVMALVTPLVSRPNYKTAVQVLKEDNLASGKTGS